jgi:hypothetical protein
VLASFPINSSDKIYSFYWIVGSRNRLLALTPFIAGLIDIAENVQIWNMLLSFPHLSGEQVAFASLTMSLKHSLVAIMILGMLIVGLNFRRKRSNGH